MKKWFGIISVIFFFFTLIISDPTLAQTPQKAPAKKPAAKPLGVEVIKFGGMGILSGPLSICGRMIMMGAQLAIEEINAKGGILGSKCELKFMDDELKPAVGVKTSAIW